MTHGFWRNLPTPCFALAPLADVTDAAFRRVIAKYGKPHILWTEFTSADRLFMPSQSELRRHLLYSEAERPIVAQLWGSNPSTMERAAALTVDLGFDGIDINMGCPDRRVEKHRAGAALCQHPDLAVSLIQAAKRGAGSVPVSVKIRIGYARNEIATWLPPLLAEEPAAIIIHARTRQEKSDVPANWDVIAQAVEIRQAMGSSSRILGNGDVQDLTEARQRANATGSDGVMLGRAIFGNPWLFNECQPRHAIPWPQRLAALAEHISLFDKVLGDVKPFNHMKKHYKAYLAGFEGAEALRLQLMEAPSAREALAILGQI